jgi:colicin import membrane protein
MKLTSFLLAILIHLIIVIVYLFAIQLHPQHKINKKVYTVDILEIKKTKTENATKKKNSSASIKTKKSQKKHEVKKKPKPISHKKDIKKKIKKTDKKKIEKKKQELAKKAAMQKRIEELRKKRIELEKKKKRDKVREKLLKERIKELKKSAQNKDIKKKNNTINDTKGSLSDKEIEKSASNYETLINSIIHNNWGVEKSLIKNKRFVCDAYIKLDFRGNLIYINILKSSGSVYFDSTVVDAIKDSEPFPMPPKEILDKGIVEFVITFDSKEKE